ncbi:MAG: hypothetical protein OEV08_09035 [Nitrospira sp.]|nr:hypothetical protein [Nitrospira sp.]
MKRKPGEPIYLIHHMLGLACTLAASLLIPLLYHHFVEPLSFITRFTAGLSIAFAGGIALYLAYRRSAQNEP